VCHATTHDLSANMKYTGVGSFDDRDGERGGEVVQEVQCRETTGEER
jgi:hypothetical protein